MLSTNSTHQVASMYINNNDLFLRTAKFWTETYARPDSSQDEVRRRLPHIRCNSTHTTCMCRPPRVLRWVIVAAGR
jgi:hypothetical protein